MKNVDEIFVIIKNRIIKNRNFLRLFQKLNNDARKLKCKLNYNLLGWFFSIPKKIYTLNNKCDEKG